MALSSSSATVNSSIATGSSVSKFPTLLSSSLSPGLDPEQPSIPAVVGACRTGLVQPLASTWADIACLSQRNVFSSLPALTAGPLLRGSGRGCGLSSCLRCWAA